MGTVNLFMVVAMVITITEKTYKCELCYSIFTLINDAVKCEKSCDYIIEKAKSNGGKND